MSEHGVLGIGSRVKHPAYDEGVVIRLHKAAYEICFMQYGIKMVGREYQALEIIEQVETDEGVTFNDMEKSLIKVLRSFSDIQENVDLGHRWVGGKMILQPDDTTLASKEIPIETFFHKIVMVRDRLRVMEQRINSNDALSGEEKVNLQQYLTRIYGSLTTFNVLFRNKEDQFKGTSSK